MIACTSHVSILTYLVGILTDGGYAEYATVRSQAVAAMPKDLDPAEVAPLLCAGVTTFSELLIWLSRVYMILTSYL